MNRIYYKSGYKYQLARDYELHTGIIGYSIHTEYAHLYSDGLLIIKNGYAWDGPSGPTIDTKTFMRGSLVHDVFYQLIREGHLSHSIKEKADSLLRNICIEDGMCKLRANWVYFGVDKFAGFATSPKNKKKLLEAP
jgi:hypothetical protein